MIVFIMNPLLGTLVSLSLVLIGNWFGLNSQEIKSIQQQVLGTLTQEASSGEYVLVTRVVDGDTFKVSLDGQEETVRLLGIDTPETKDPRKEVECFGEEASRELESLVANKPVKLVPDLSQPNRDTYQRLLRYVYLEDGTFVNQHMVQEGFALVYTAAAVEYLEEFKTLADQARAHNKGLWASCRDL